MFQKGWWLWPVGRHVEKHGTKDFSTSMDFIYEVTKTEWIIKHRDAKYKNKITYSNF
ncbi:hypothetical protein [Methanobacterium movens]